VLDVVPLPLRQIAELAVLTLMRLSEIRRLRREHVRLADGIVVLAQTKTDPRVVILSGAAREILREELAASASEWVFPGPRTGRPYSREPISRLFRRHARQAVLRDFDFHDLRPSRRDEGPQCGLSAPVGMDLGGWTNHATMRRYAAVTNRTLRAAAEGGERCKPSA
jgi:integrase